MTISALPFDDIRALLRQAPPLSETAMAAVRERCEDLVEPAGSLGRLEEIAVWMAGCQGTVRPSLNRPFAVVFAASHGVWKSDCAGPGGSAPIGTPRQRMEIMAAGGAAVNQIAAAFGVGLKVFELALDLPTADFTAEAALDEKSAAATFAFGMEAVADHPDLLCLGAIGDGADTAAAAICHALYGDEAADWVCGDKDAGAAFIRAQAAIVAAGVELHGAARHDPLELMRRLGGRETCALAGAIAAARLQNVPVVLDGYAVCAAAALLHAIDPALLDHCLAGHAGAAPAQANVLERLGKRPLLDLGLSPGAGAGTGAVLAAGLIKAAVACHNDMATQAQAGLRANGAAAPS